MKIATGVLTHNAIFYDRVSLLEQAVSSLRAAFNIEPLVLDNGSIDGTGDLVTGMSRCSLFVSLDDCSPGTGMQVLISRLVSELGEEGGLIVVSDDDMLWHPKAGEALTSIWKNAPPDLGLLCAYLEPEWPWNTAREAVEIAGRRVLVRDSAPAAAWTFPACHWGALGPLQPGWHFDTTACRKLQASRLKVAQIDLASHEGWKKSTHANEALVTAKPLDREHWGI